MPGSALGNDDNQRVKSERRTVGRPYGGVGVSTPPHCTLSAVAGTLEKTNTPRHRTWWLFALIAVTAAAVSISLLLTNRHRQEVACADARGAFTEWATTPPRPYAALVAAGMLSDPEHVADTADTAQRKRLSSQAAALETHLTATLSACTRTAAAVDIAEIRLQRRHAATFRALLLDRCEAEWTPDGMICGTKRA